MVTFKQYLTEKYSQPIYHGTGLFQLMGMVNHNELNTGIIDPVVPTPRGINKGILFTVSFDQAKNWAKYRSNFPIVVQFDHSRIASRYKMKALPTAKSNTGKKTIVDRMWSALKYRPIPGTTDVSYIVTSNMRDINSSIVKIYMDDTTKSHISQEWPDLYDKIYGVLYTRNDL